MTLFSPIVSYPPIAKHDRPDWSDTDLGVWASIVLIGLLAIISIALGMSPVIDPGIFLLS